MDINTYLYLYINVTKYVHSYINTNAQPQIDTYSHGNKPVTRHDAAGPHINTRTFMLECTHAVTETSHPRGAQAGDSGCGIS
jgi:hypothetical protein